MVGDALAERGRTLACAESLTGGGLGERITAVPGASAFFLGSAVVYALEAKRSILGVSAATLDGPGPVSRECAAEMAAGARRVFAADVTVALTGAAGPEAHGGAEPGQVWIAIDADELRHQHGFRLAVRSRPRASLLGDGGARPRPSVRARPPAPGLRV